ncbi:MAG: CocE/NonD family hydrolase [Croceibacterium sp.]
MASLAGLPGDAVLAQADSPSAPFEQSQYIESFDGTKLAVTVFRPARAGQPTPGRFPVIVTQDRSEVGNRNATRNYFVDHGYVVVAQDRRGTGASFGTQVGFITREDLGDAKAVIEWAAGQDFSTGAVGAMGCSNQGVWQYGVTALHPKGLKAIAPACASPEFFDDAAVKNGVPMFEFKDSLYDATCAPGEPVGRTAQQLGAPKPVDADRDGALLRQALATRGCTSPMLGQYWLNMPRDGWNAYGLYRPALDETPITHWQEIKNSGVAILQLGGWFDAAPAGQLQGQHLWGGRLIMGPWVHGNRAPPEGSLPAGQVDLNAEMLSWFDHYLKGVDNGEPRTGVQYYVLNAVTGEEWRTVPSWPDNARMTTFYLAPGSLSKQPPAARSAPGAISGDGVRWFDGIYAPLGRRWVGDMAASNVGSLVHTSEALPVDTEMTGTPTAKLWITSDSPDLNLYAAIEDVAPDGKSTYVTDGRLRASWRAVTPMPWGGLAQNWHRGFAVDLKPLERGNAAELVFDFFPTSYIFPAGHKIRVALSTANGSLYQQPPSAAGNIPAAQLLEDPQHRSQILLPLID